MSPRRPSARPSCWTTRKSDARPLGRTTEAHYGCPMDMEWAKDGETGEMFIVQARPEPRSAARAASFRSTTTEEGPHAGDCCRSATRSSPAASPIEDARHRQVRRRPILVTGTTDPDWVLIMKRAAAIVTDHGGRTSHAAIVSRELACRRSSAPVTPRRCCIRTGGHRSAPRATRACPRVRSVRRRTRRRRRDPHGDHAQPRQPAAALRWWRSGRVGLARMEFVVSNTSASIDGAGAVRPAQGRKAGRIAG